MRFAKPAEVLTRIYDAVIARKYGKRSLFDHLEFIVLTPCGHLTYTLWLYGSRHGTLRTIVQSLYGGYVVTV